MKQTIINEFGETVVTMASSDRGSLTAEELEMIRRMDDVEDEYDEDCPAMPEAMIIQMQKDIEARGRTRMVRGAQTADMQAGGVVGVV